MNNDWGPRDQEAVDADGQDRAGAASLHARPVTGPGQPSASPGQPLFGPGEPGRGQSADGANGQSPGRARLTPAPGRGGRAGGGGRHSLRPGAPSRRRGRSWWVELPVLFVFALVLALLIKTFVIQAFFIPSSSMENTLKIGDKVLVNKLVYDFRPIHRGDVVVFNGDGSWNVAPAPAKPPLVRLWDAVSGLFGTAPGVHDYIKRVIGVPGDHVVCCDPQGRIRVNGVPLNEKSYLYPGNAPSTQPFNIIVPPGRLWVMGDHRAVSWDSRGHMSDPGNGSIPESHVVGRAFLIIAPVSRWRVLPIPATFEQPRLTQGAAALAGSAPAALAGSAPVTLGFAGAIPLTWLERRIRRRRRRRGGGGRPGRLRPGSLRSGLRGLGRRE